MADFVAESSHDQPSTEVTRREKETAPEVNPDTIEGAASHPEVDSTSPSATDVKGSETDVGSGESRQQLRRRTPEKGASGSSPTTGNPERKASSSTTASTREEDRDPLMEDEQLNDNEESNPRNPAIEQMQTDTGDANTQQVFSPCFQHVSRRTYIKLLISGVIIITGLIITVIVLSHIIITRKSVSCRQEQHPSNRTCIDIVCQGIEEALKELRLQSCHMEPSNSIQYNVSMKMTNELEALADQSNCTFCRIRGRPLFITNDEHTISAVNPTTGEVQAVFYFNGKSIGVIKVDWIKRLLFVTSDGKSILNWRFAAIHSVELDNCGRKMTEVYDQVLQSDIAVDTINEFIIFYYMNPQGLNPDRRLVRIEYTSKEPTIIYTFKGVEGRLLFFDTLVADPIAEAVYIARFFFWTIWKCNYDGGCSNMTSPSAVRESGSGDGISGLTLDMNERVLYWFTYVANASSNYLLYTYDLNTGRRQSISVEIMEDLVVASLVMRNNYLFFIEHGVNCTDNPGLLRRVAKTGGQLELFGKPLIKDCNWICHRMT